MTAATWHAIVEGEPGIFPAPVARVLRALGGLGRRRRPVASRLVVYGDFTCPFSALASSRAAEWERRGAVVEWRAVEHLPEVPAPSAPGTPEQREEVEGELARVRRLLADGEPDRLRPPPRRVNTRAAVEAFAAAPPAERAALRERLFAAHWEHGEDLADPDVLHRLAGAGTDAALAARWREEWQALRQPVIPVLVWDGMATSGVDALARLLPGAGGPG